MLTCCPKCQTHFRVRQAQLHVARGKVRCGKCHHVFNARLHLFEDKSPATPSTFSTGSTQINQNQQPTPDTKTPSQPETATPVEANVSNENINAIFNALDIQLASGTYIDIAKENTRGTPEEKAKEKLTASINETLPEPDEDENASNISVDDPVAKDVADDATAGTAPTSQHQLDFIDLPSAQPEQEQHFTAKIANEDLHAAINSIIRIDETEPAPSALEPEIELIELEDDEHKFVLYTEAESGLDIDEDAHRDTRQNEPDQELPQKLVKNISLNDAPPDDIYTAPDASEDLAEDALYAEGINAESEPVLQDQEPEFENQQEIIITARNDFGSVNSSSHPELDPGFNQGFTADPDQVPPQLRDAVDALNQAPTHWATRLGLVIIVLILCAGLLIQLVMFKSPWLAQTIPTLSPYLSTACNTLPCRNTAKRNPKLITMLNRDVRLHPKSDGALLISATIISRAPYPQPYPVILVRFTDLTGAVVAQRYFQPAEYLGKLNRPFVLMHPNKPLQFSLEVLDPGKDAVNFEFRFL